MGQNHPAEKEQVETANASGRTPVVFVHGLWLLPSSWDRWRSGLRGGGLRDAVARAGRTTPTRSRRPTRTPRCSPSKTVGQIADHFADVIGQLDRQAGDHRALLRRPARPRSSPGAGLSAASVAIDPAPFRGVLPLPISALQVGVAGAAATRPTVTAPCRSPTTSSGTRSPTRSARTRPRSCTTRTPCPAPGVPLFQAATANLNPWTEVKVDTKNPERGPLLIISGEKDHTRPVGDRQRLVQAAEAQPGRHRDRRDAGPRPLPDHRQRLGRGRRDGAGVRPAVRAAVVRAGAPGRGRLGAASSGAGRAAAASPTGATGGGAGAAGRGSRPGRARREARDRAAGSPPQERLFDRTRPCRERGPRHRGAPPASAAASASASSGATVDGGPSVGAS